MMWQKGVFTGLFILLNLFAQPINAQKDSIPEEVPETFFPEIKWNDIIRISGYTQVRYNGLFETNPDLKCDQCDKSWGGGNNGFFFRRIRIKFAGNVHEKVYFYIQPDFASSPGGGNQQFAQIRDAYFDLALDKKKEFRFRIGQSKVPFGFENMQSSQNRLPLDRHDGLNSAVKNERDIGIFFYWAPDHVRKRFASLSKKGLKHSGDYGMFGLGVYNGQTANVFELNNSQHVVTRFSYPFEFANGQIFEPGIQAYTGQFVLPNVTEGVTVNDDYEYLDQRAAVSAVLYAQPFGIQAEYNIGRGPEYIPETNSIEMRDLHGGYATLTYRFQIQRQVFFPFARYHYYKGGKKHERDATKHRVSELEVGMEWQPIKNFELVAMYTFSDRTFENALNPINRQIGSLLRLQLQLNF